MRRHRSTRFALAGLVLLAALGVRAAEPPRKADEAEEFEEAAQKRSPKEEELHLCLDRSGQLVYQTEACPPNAAPASKPAPPPVPTPVAKPPVATKLPAKPPAKLPAKPEPARVDQPRERQLRYAKPTAPAKRLRVDPLPNVDPRYATPERTWSTFSTALRAGDGPAARSCLTPGALEGLAPSVESVIGGGPWSVFVDDAARVELEGHTGPFWSMRLERRGVRPKWVFLVRGERGEWKIAAL